MTMRHILLALGLLVAGGLALFGDKSSGGSVSEPVARAAVPATASNISAQNAVSPPVTFTRVASNSNGKTEHEITLLAIAPRESLIGGAHGGRKTESLFGMQSWTPPPPLPKIAVAPPPPMAPPLPFSYVGKKSEDGLWEVYLARGEKTYIVREKNTIDNLYRVDAIAPPTITLTYLPLNQTQMLTIGGID